MTAMTERPSILPFSLQCKDRKSEFNPLDVEEPIMQTWQVDKAIDLCIFVVDPHSRMMIRI